MTQKDYTLIEKNQLYQIAENEQFLFYDQLDYNLAYVYKKQNEYILIPQLGKKGVWFHSEESYQNAVKLSTFPEDEEPVNKFHRDKEMIYAFDFDSIICKLIDKEIISDKEFYTHEDFSVISKKLNALKEEKKLSNEILYELGFFLLKCFKQKINGEWGIEVEYTINLHWRPFVNGKKNSKKYGPLFWKTLMEQSIINIEEVLLINLADYVGLQVFSENHANFLNKKWEDITID